MGSSTNSANQTIALPQGGGALQGIGEKFAPDLHTGTGNYNVPLALPPGRNGYQPQLNLAYSTGNGNGPFGLGWGLSIPNVTRKTAKGVPLYQDDSPAVKERDTFLVSRAEDLVPVDAQAAYTRYQPRTEGLFARINHCHEIAKHHDYWEVRSKDGLVSVYGTPGAASDDPAAIADPQDRGKVFAWNLTFTRDPFGNRIEYEYLRDTGQDDFHHWDQLYLEQLRYADYVESGTTKFLVTVTFVYADRCDCFSEYRAGFEIRTRKRCKQIRIATHAGVDQLVRTYDLIYLDERAGLERPQNDVSLLSQIVLTGYDGTATEQMPPVEFGYTRFEPEARRFTPIGGAELPPNSLAQPDYTLADLFGKGLPDILEMNGTVRYWRNLGKGAFDPPREMRSAPTGIGLADPGVQLLDADGDGRADLLVHQNGLSGYFPLRFGGEWDRRSFKSYSAAPSFSLRDPEVRMVDLDGDGVTDAIRSGTRLECFFNDPANGWSETRFVERRSLPAFPNVNFSDPRVQWADMTGDGLQDIVLIHDGSIQYWPNLGRGNWGKCVTMYNSPHLPLDYDPQRILLGDIDGDGAADVVYVENDQVTLWVNQSGNGWSAPIPIRGTPPVTNMDAVRLTDLLGAGVSGILWSAEAGRWSRTNMYFLDFTGAHKPYLLNELNNHTGAVTRIEYASSTRFYLDDQKQYGTHWKTPLPFPVQVVARVEILDEISQGKLTTEYRYHHGYWDGAEREFRGFGMVEQLDTETLARYNTAELHGDAEFVHIESELQFSHPTLTKTWFHQGPIGDEFGDWDETDFCDEFWAEDPQVLMRPAAMSDELAALPRRVKRDALRTLRGTILRTELYARDGTTLATRPYTVTEHVYGVRDESPEGHPPDQPHIFFPHPLAERTTQWERGSEPMTQFAFTGDYDAYGQPRAGISIAVPRGRNPLASGPAGAPYLATLTLTVFAQRDDASSYVVDRVARTTGYEIVNDGSACVFDLRDRILSGAAARGIMSQTINFYDGDAFKGLAFGQLGSYGALVRTESLVLTEEILQRAYKSGSDILNPPEIPPYLKPSGSPNHLNLALAANGGTASASSTYDGDTNPALVNNGERKGVAGYWTDNTLNVYPDWIEVQFSEPKTINEIDVFTTQDAPLDGTGAAVEPTLDLTFSRYGITAFDVQTWTGSDWATIPGGSVTGNNKVWRKFSFPNITSSKIRVVVNNAVGGRSRVVEVEAYEAGTSVNVARVTNGGTAVASSVLQPWPPRMATDGDRIGYHWKGQQPFSFPGWFQVDLNGVKTIEEIDLYFHQDTSKPFVPPTEDTTSPYVLSDFDVQYWDGSNWTTIPNGSVDDNTRVWRQFRFAPLTTNKIRVWIRGSATGNAAIMEVEAYAADPALLGSDYPPEFVSLLPTLEGASDTRPGLQLTSVGYGFASGAAPYARGYFAATARQRYDFQEAPQGQGRGLVTIKGDPLGHDTAIAYDTYQLLPMSTTDPAGLSTYALNDYRLLKPYQVTDINGNRILNTFTPLGLPKSSAVMGKTGENVGDTLQSPGLQYIYDFNAFVTRQQPISVRTIRRVHHTTDTSVPLPQRDETIETLEYSDGFGRLIQTRAQAEDIRFGDPVFADGLLPSDQTLPIGDTVGSMRVATDAPRVRVSGWEVYDNKGHVIVKYEPFFSTGWDYAPPQDAPGRNEFGQKVAMFYDPRGQLVRTVNANGSEQRVIYGVPVMLTSPDEFAPNPWETYTYDANDNAGRTHPGSSTSFQSHWDTPLSSERDALGRVIKTVERNGTNPAAGWYTSSSTYDIRGNLVSTTDALGRVALLQFYDLTNRAWRIEQLDAGVQRTILDAAGNKIEQRDSKGALILQSSDVLNRPQKGWARDGVVQALKLRQVLIYGDMLDRTQVRAVNLLGKMFKQYDEAGLVVFEQYDFKGNLLEKALQVIKDALILGVFSPTPPNWQVPAFRVNWQPPVGTLFEDYAATQLDAIVYRSSMAYDARNRLKSLAQPQAVDGMRHVLYPHYNRAGALERVELDNVSYVKHIAYSAKGQRTLIAYGNGVMTRYAHDAQTFLLRRLRTERYTNPTTLTYHPTGALQQDFAYEYDLMGNLTKLHDRAPGSGIPAHPDSLDRDFIYDALYRLLSASGRECDVPQPLPWDGTPRCTDVTRSRQYVEQYVYDAVSNQTQLQHTATNGSFTRALALVNASNRLATMTTGSTITPYVYDACGNMIDESTSRHFEWDHSNQMRVYRTQAANSEPSVHTHYLYNAEGQRVKKLVRKQGGQYEATIYIDGIFEHNRTIQGSTTRENNTLHIIDNSNRIALVRIGNPFPGDSTPAVKYHLGDHLGSSSVVIDSTGSWLNREDYTPYGETSFGCFALKRYRFSGKERDEESGLYYHGARYYAAWSAKWVSCDPAGMVDGTNLYLFSRANPLTLRDPSGLQSETSEQPEITLVDPNTMENVQVCRQGAPQTREASEESANTRDSTAEEDASSKPPDVGSIGSLLSSLGILLSKAGSNAGKTSSILWTGEEAGEGAMALAKQAPELFRAMGSGRIGKSAAAIHELVMKLAPNSQRLKTFLYDTLWKAASALHGFKGGISGEKLVKLIQTDIDLAKRARGMGEILRKIEVPAYRLGKSLVPAAKALGRALPIIGGLLSGAGLAQDIKSGDVSSGVGNALGVLEAGAAVVGAGSASMVIGAAAGGYALGTVLNEHFVQPLIDKAAPGSGSLGDWYYRTFLK